MAPDTRDGTLPSSRYSCAQRLRESPHANPGHAARHRVSRSLVIVMWAALSLYIVVVHPHVALVDAMVLRRAWTTQHWCRSVRVPRWPFAYQKHTEQRVEWKGRTNANDQDMRHVCVVFGVESKCHRCEDIACGAATCAFQIQGVDWAQLPKNIPTVTDVPWAVGGRHRYDYGVDNGRGVCLFLSGGDCITPLASDYSTCTVRCWGVGAATSGRMTYTAHPERGNASRLTRDDADAADIWSYPSDFTGDGKPQGRVTTLAGSGTKGFLDGALAVAQFNSPQDVAVDSKGVVYVADTDNHRIRRVDPSTNAVTTLAGDGSEGCRDGAASTARFSYPTGVAVYEDASNNGKVVVYVADTGNHRIRKIVDGVVSCFAGLCGNGVESAILTRSPAVPHAGLADGDPVSSRFDTPMGIAVDLNGEVFVADTGNHLVRRIDPDGTTRTLAGSVAPSNDVETPGCVTPCLKGVAGFRDGNLTFAQFNSPRDVAIGLQNTIVVADGHRIRRVNYDGSTSVLEGVTSSNRVVTLAGSSVPGSVDGAGDEATLHAPAGVTVSADGRVHVVSPISCKLRQISTASQVARPIDCTTKLTQVLLPGGCSSYEPPVDELFLRVSPVTNNIYYNYRQRAVNDSTDGLTLKGRQIKDCTGTPPIDALELGNLSLALRDPSTLTEILDIKEDQEDGMTVKLKCPSGCASSSAPAYGSGFYTDESAICRAAIHAGVIADAAGGLIEVMLERGINYYNASVSTGSTSSGVTTLPVPVSATSAARLFSIRAYPLAQVEVHTVAGHPAAQLKSGCGYADGMPPLAARFNGPHGVEIYSQHSPSRSQQLVIADSWNHRIRQMTASCSKICENGGVCVATDTCSCASGWSGDDCSIPICAQDCTGRQVCVGPDTCACIPGYTGAPACSTPLCVQSCANGGSCIAPDTCGCASGWFDANCTTPVCSQTCGNGGNCTAPSTCSCPSEWSGRDCRIPVCKQSCTNGGSCVAPDTCLCAAGWSGHDCSLPICPQGLFVAHPSAYLNAQWRPFSFENYVPCDLSKWCQATGEFDCLARVQQSPVVDAQYGPAGRAVTGRVVDPQIDAVTKELTGGCLLIELSETALSHYQYITETNATTGIYRFAPKAPYGWNATMRAAWRGIVEPESRFLPPFNHASDRQVALVERRSVVQGVYACANGGSCVSPGICQCAAGWIGFDCRTPVCNQGYYVPMQPTYFAADPPLAKDPRQPTANPQYSELVETIAYDAMASTTVTRGRVRYKLASGEQGGYACSIRSITKWEKPTTLGPYASAEYYFEHPNYFSGYMDKTLQHDGYYHTYWEGMHWPPLYQLTKPLLDDTREGWRRGGTWQRIPSNKWQKGTCLVQFNRTCTRQPMEDLLTNTVTLVEDTDASYRPRVSYTISAAARVGYWNQTISGDCVDEVVRGCYNNGTCIAPDTCRCALGWTGADCSIPVCQQTCQHNGNCTLPNRCTCEIGWTGNDCSIPMCAQECRNGGKCVAPDKCQCVQWGSTWRDGREDGGEPVFRTPEGQAQLTGFTGYDCNTPICVQAERFVHNVKRDTDGFLSLRGHGKDGKLTCATSRCPQYDHEVVSNDGASFQSGCSVGNPLPNPVGVMTDARKILNLRNHNDSLNTRRKSDGYLCGNVAWEEGDYTTGRYMRVNYVNVTKVDDETWVYGESTPGEGVYMCYHKGSCVAPDTCSCGDGWQGIDCNVPICRYLQANGTVVTGCPNDGVCVDKDTCQCITVASTLHEQHPTAPRGLTGHTGADCTIPICIQGVFDPLCTANGTAGVEGCYRCKNGGVCVAPDVCQCADGWEGFDCSRPICRLTEKQANATVRAQLFTVDDQKVLDFLEDPCGTHGGRWGKEEINGARIGQGNCTLPHKCTCLCRQKYDPVRCRETGDLCEKPWKDPFRRAIPAGYVYGTRNCVDGFQGLEDADGNLISCHLQIYVPSLYRRYTVSMVALLSVASVLVLIAWYYIRQNIRKRRLLAKAERRRSRKNSEENPAGRPTKKSNAFIHPKQA